MGWSGFSQDYKSKVFKACVKCAIHFGRMGLKVFLLENLLGVLKSWNRGPIFMSAVVEHFTKKMPWLQYRVEVTNSKRYGLPQNRPRVFLVGYHRHLAPSAFYDCC